MPELLASDMEELMECMDRVFEADECLEARRNSRKRMFDIPDFEACQRVFRAIESI